jgi:hypothetical protein
MKKALKWLGIVLFALLGVPLAVLLLINLRDEALLPEAVAYMRNDAASLPDEQNAFYYLLGFGAPLADDPHKAGKAWLVAVNQAQESLLKGAEANWPAQPEGLPKIAATCSPDRESCVRWLKDKAQAGKLVEDNRQAIGRYRGVHAYPGYRDMTDARLLSYPMPSFTPLASAQRLYLLDIAQRFERGEVDAPLAALRDEIALARRMMAGSHSLLQKVLATAQLVRTSLFASDVLSAHRARIGPKAAVLAGALAPLSAEERGLAPTLRSEFAMAASASDPSRWHGEDFGIGIDTMFARPFYQQRASVNLLYGFTRAWSEVDQAPAAELDAAFARARAAEPKFSAWGAIYNPVGKLLVFINALQPAGYFERVHDADALVRMVALQAQIVAKNVKPDAIDSRNPYTGKPYGWDAQTRQLYFEPRGSSLKERRIGGVANRVGITL